MVAGEATRRLTFGNTGLRNQEVPLHSPEPTSLKSDTAGVT